MRSLVLMISVLMLSTSGCGYYARYQERTAHAELLRQQALITEDYRACLSHNADNPAKQRDCSVYNQSRTQLDITGIK